jgi:hypothetical protein
MVIKVQQYLIKDTVLNEPGGVCLGLIKIELALKKNALNILSKIFLLSP